MEMTIAEYLRVVGPRTKAWAEGRAEGLAEGRAEHAARLLVRLLTRKFGSVPDAVRERIDAASLEQLEIWSDRVLDAPTLDELLG
jgi:hypothetical protein